MSEAGDSARVPIPERILQLLGSIFGIFPLGNVVCGVPKACVFTIGTFFAVVNLGLLGYSTYEAVAGNNQSDWISGEDSSVQQQSTTSNFTMRIYEISTMIGYFFVVVAALWRSPQLETMMEKYLRMRTIARQFNWDLSNGLPELILFLAFCAMLDAASWILWTGYWISGLKFIEYSFYIMSVYTPFLSVTLLRPCKLFLRNIRRSFPDDNFLHQTDPDFTGSPHFAGQRGKTFLVTDEKRRLGGNRISCENDREYRSDTVFSSYVLVFDICEDFSRYCGAVVVVAAGLNFLYIITWINNVTIYATDPLELSPWRMSAYAVMTLEYTLVFLILNVTAQGIADEDDALRIKIRNMGSANIFMRIPETGWTRHSEKLSRLEDKSFATYFDSSKTCDTLDRILSHRPLVVTADGFFQLKKNTLTSMLSLIVTYVIILMQFQVSEQSTRSIEATMKNISNCTA